VVRPSALANGDGAQGGLGVIDPRGAGAQHLAVGERGDETLDRIVQLKVALFHQQQGRQRGYLLGVGESAEDGVFAHRRAGFLVGLAHAVHVDQIAPRQHGTRHAGQVVIHLFLLIDI
jgi:hypothetical protein